MAGVPDVPVESRGEPPAPVAPSVDAALEALYRRLQAIAGACLRRERPDHTLQATALVNEAWLRLVRQEAIDWSDPAHVQALAAQAMRRILVDSARRHGAQKRGGDGRRIELETLPEAAHTAGTGPLLGGVDLLALEEALGRLADIEPQLARIVELRFFGDCTLDRIAIHLGMPRRSVDRAWNAARAWLYRELHREGSG